MRTLELTINRRLDTALHGNHQGLTPGHGSEPGEARLYQPGDDVRRIDWNVTARTLETHVRDQIADRDLEAWLVVDTSAAMRFGTVVADKAQIALAATAGVGFLTARNQNRLGAILVAGPHLKVLPPRFGRDQVRAVLSAAAAPPAVRGPRSGRPRGRPRPCRRRRAPARLRRRRLGLRRRRLGRPAGPPGPAPRPAGHRRPRPRELDVPPVGMIEVVDPSTGRHREVRVTAKVQRRFATAAAELVEARRMGIRRAGAELIELATDADWLSTIVDHVRRKRVQAVNAQVLRRT